MGLGNRLGTDFAYIPSAHFCGIVKQHSVLLSKIPLLRCKPLLCHCGFAQVNVVEPQFLLESACLKLYAGLLPRTRGPTFAPSGFGNTKK